MLNIKPDYELFALGESKNKVKKVGFTAPAAAAPSTLPGGEVIAESKATKKTAARKCTRKAKEISPYERKNATQQLPGGPSGPNFLQGGPSGPSFFQGGPSGPSFFQGGPSGPSMY